MRSIVKWWVADVVGRSRVAPRGVQGQSGYVLPLTIAVVLLLSLIGLGLLGYVFTTLRVTRAAVGWADDTRAVDAALDSALQRWRLDEDLPCSPTASPVIHGDYDVYCQRGPGDDSDPLQDPDPDRRVLDLTAAERGGAIVGKARVRVIDVTLGQRVPGSRVEVCDWLIGPGVNAASRSLNGCTSAP